ncbi:unnamed protein product [Cercospora beticola]|nr:unnamed protein product [Cercospora beticola]
MATTSSETTTDVVIIGAGISGMTLAIDMMRLGNGDNFVIIEKGRRVGGTWSDNEYPGCCCDVWSHLYSLSFSPNPDWTREYPTQPEIHRYLTGVAHKYDLERHIRFNTEVKGCKFDPVTGIWTTTVRRGDDGGEATLHSRFVVSAMGQLNNPQYPKITGMDDFAGRIMHSARWDKSFDLRGKKVAVIGNGATAIQIVPELAKIAESVVVFQRSPNWITPRYDSTIPAWRQFMYRYLPYARRRYRSSLMDIREDYWNVLVDTDGEAHQGLKAMATELLSTQLPGENRAELRQVLTPNYPPGCKRILISDDYYPALGKPHVTLETAPILEITEEAVRVSSGWDSRKGQHQPQDHVVDAIICATGFQAKQFLSPLHIEVAGQETLEQKWSGGAYAYKGMTVPDLPNFAIMYGPNTNLGHNSIILMIEAQSAYINRLIEAVRTNAKDSSRGYLRISPRESATKNWNNKVQASLSKSTLASDQCSSWYKSDTGLITTNWSENAIEYQRDVSSIDWEDYQLQGPGAAELRSKGRISWTRVVEESQPWVTSWSKAAAVSVGLGILAVAVSPLRKSIVR